MLLQNQLYVGILDVTEYGVRAKGDFNAPLDGLLVAEVPRCDCAPA
jgi:hypothetical protein